MTSLNKAKKAGGMSSVKSTIAHLLKSKKAKDNIKNLLKVNQDKGFDCPGCAWGDKVDGAIQFCENGAKAIAWESTDKKVTAKFFEQYSVTQLMKQSDYWLEYQGRLTEPMKYNAQTDHYEAISWDDANQFIAEQINSLESPDELELYTSGRASNEVAYLYQLFGRTLGTNNFPDCSNLCHEASGVALTQSIGVGKGTVVLEDFEHADAIFVFGQNPGTNHPRMMNSLRSAAKRGSKIVSFNNLKEIALERFASPQDPVELLSPAATKISHAYFTPKLGGDFAAVRAMVKVILKKHSWAINQAFIKTHTLNFTEYCDKVFNTPWEPLLEQSGLSREEIEYAALIFVNAPKVITTWAMGLTQHKHSVDTIREITNLHLLTGKIGEQGTGLCPVRGHSNVQGNRTVGINENPTEAFIDRLNQYFNIKVPYEGGHNVYQALKHLNSGKSKIIICLGGNLAAASSDTAFTHKALANTQLNVQISTKLNRSHLLVGKHAIILPCLGRTELDIQKTGPQFITVEDTFSMVHASQGRSEVTSKNCRSEISIIGHIADKTLGHNPIDWLAMVDDYSKIRELIAATIPQFEQFNEKVQAAGGFHLANSAHNLTWNTPEKKACFSYANLPTGLFPQQVEALISKQSSLVLTLQTMRSHDQYNTTIYGMNDRYRGVFGQRKVLFMNPKDGKKLKLNDGDIIQITSIWHDNETRKIDGFKIVYYDIPKGNVAGYYPETNPLVPIDSVGDKSFTPTSKSIPVIVSLSKSVIA